VPEGCLDLSALDGFMAGIIAGPAPAPPCAWLPVVWGEPPPRFDSAAELRLVLRTIRARHDEIAAGLDAVPARYAPVFWEDVAGTRIVDDWVAGFMTALALHPDAWEPALRDAEAAALLLIITTIARMTRPEADAGEPTPLDRDLDPLVDTADLALPACVVGLRRFRRGRSAGSRRRARSGRRRRAGPDRS
jgi:uncharacterized protein